MRKNNTLSPLFVDIDGTLIKTDLLYEGLVGLLKTQFMYLFLVPFWLLKGKAYLKYRVAKLVGLDFSLLPYNKCFIEFLIKEKEKGRRIFIASASNIDYANKVAEYLGIFDEVLASTEFNNLKSVNKLVAIKKMSSEFSYAGNEVSDFKIFKESVESYLVNPGEKALSMTKEFPVTKVLYDKKNKYLIWAKALRLHQWLKNILIFVPLFVSDSYMELDSVYLALYAFFAFGLLASATYLVNDLLDLNADRKHPRKKYRAFASGDLPILHGFFCLFFLIVIIVVVCLNTSVYFKISLVSYLLITLLYSFYLKKIVLADVITLAGLFTMRIIAGASVLNITPSFWLLAFSMFTFFSLALVKRCAEIKVLEKYDREYSEGRGYILDDYLLMQSLGVTSAFMSILIMAFYVQNSYSVYVYTKPFLLWLTLPAFAYWLCRMWLKTSRSEMHDDPIIFTLKDRGSIVTLAFICFITFLSKA